MSNKNFTVYKSSAGSGKTFTLVKEYLAIALNDAANPPQAYKHILAITFTKKAASEMKDRIIKALKELSEDDYTKLSVGTATLLNILKSDEFLNKQKQLDDDTIRLRAKNILTAILHNYSDFAIGTIDAFVHKVVRTFAFDLKIPMSFEIEMDGEKLLTEAIDLLIAQIGTDERLTKALVEFTESKTDDEKSWHIENDLLEFSKNLLNEEGAVYIEKLKDLKIEDFFKIKDSIYSEIKKFENNIKEEAKKAIALIKSNNLTSKQFYFTDTGIAGYFEKLANGRMDLILPNTRVQATVGEDKWLAGKMPTEVLKAIESIKSELLNHFMKIKEFIEKDYSNYVLFTLINRNIYSLAVLNEIEKLLIQYKAENNIVHISEFNKMISKIVMNEPIPFIYERLGEKYNNYLIDEFQDTSVLQFQNLLPLIDNSLASGHFTMLVGDGKQAIYRWRGSELEQFAMLPKVFAHNDNSLVLEREKALIRNHEPKVLKKNFRSKREIIEFNNALFTTLSAKLNDRYKIIYDNLNQEFSPDNSGGYVQVEFLEKENQYEQNIARCLEIIFKLKEDNFSLKDIAILVRKNMDGSEIANYLTQHNIPVLSSDSLLLNNSSEVNFLHSILKYLSNNADQIIQTEILEYFIAKKIIKNSSLDELLSQKNKSGFFSIIKSVSSEFNVVRLSKMALYELSEELIRIFKLNSIPDAYIQFFLDEVLSYTIKKNNNLPDFIEFWEERKLKASLVIPEGMDAVNIMTIHRSKGLEFPVVILPFSNSKLSMGKNNLWIDVENNIIPELPSALVPTNKLLKETIYGDLFDDEKNKSLLDSLNVLYVAFTRAEKRMYILSGQPGKDSSNLGTVSDMLAYFYQNKGEWKEGQSFYSFGKESIQPKLESNFRLPTLNFELLFFNSNKWRESIKMRAAAPGIWNTEFAETKKDYGVVLHTAMARVRHADDIEHAVNSMLEEGLINKDEKDKLLVTIHKIVKLPQIAPHFTKGLTIKNETEIISITGKKYRLDRVILRNNDVVVIDYKSSKAKKEENIKQIIEYGDLLAQMGYNVTEKLLVFIEEEEVERV